MSQHSPPPAIQPTDSPLPNTQVSQQLVPGQIEASPHLQFTLREMLIAITALAVVLALCSQMMVVGALLVWALAVIGTITTVPLRKPALRGVRLLTWGVVMPLICLAFDPMFFVREDLKNGFLDGRPTLHSHFRQYHLLQFMAFAGILFQMAAMIMWVFRARRGPREAAVMNGILAIGFFVAACTSAVVGMFAVAGTALGYFIAILGFTPLFTAWAYWVASGEAREQAETALSPVRRWSWAMLGILLAIAVPVGVAVGVWSGVQWQAGKL